MEHLPIVRGSAIAVLEQIKMEYADLVRSKVSFSLLNLLNSSSVSIEEFCSDFVPHLQGKELIRLTEDFGKQNNIWLANARQHVTCALFVYPNGQFDRMLTMMKNLAFGFYLNDTMGRDTFQFLRETEKETARKLISNMAGLDEKLQVGTGACPLELTNVRILREFREHSPKLWFRRFLDLYCHHLNITHTDGNTDAMGHIPDVEEYMEQRCHLGGVHHILAWIEYSENQFLDWSLLRQLNISPGLERLHWASAAFAGLANDLFSFEKEVIANYSDSNLVAILMHNSQKLKLAEAIIQASAIVRTLLIEIMDLLGLLRNKIAHLENSYADLRLSLQANLNGVVRCVQSIWTWHTYSERYKRSNSIFKECAL